MGKMESPKELVAVSRKNGIFAMMNNLTLTNCEGRNSALQFYQGNLARFVVYLIKPKEFRLMANIPASEVASIRKKTDFACNKEYEMQLGVENDAIPIAYTEKFRANNFLKGKTPAQILMENPEKGKDILNNQYAYLRKNSGDKRYQQGNQKMMKAIMDASKLLKEGNLDLELTRKYGGKSFKLYDAPLRPLESRKNAKGLCFVYSLSIRWVLGTDNPVMVELSNFYSSLIKKEDGTFNVSSSVKEDEQKFSFAMEEKEWLHVLYMMEMSMRTFEDIHAKELYDIAEKADKENWQEARNANNKNQG